MPRKKLIHVHSNVKDKAPQQGTLEKGEIAINYNPESPAMYIVDNNNATLKFFPMEVIDNITAATKNDFIYILK